VEAKTFLGFDFGMNHIGVAVGQTLTDTATPLEVLPARDGIPDWQHLAQLIEAWHPDGLVVGLPTHEDGTEYALTDAARRFQQRLRGRFRLPVYAVDERLSSMEAKRLRPARDSRQRPPRVDDVAAQLILQTWLEQHREKAR
jgi:putative Holliday junction resolvase